MKLNILIEDRTHTIEVPADVLEQGEEFFQRIDRDMDRGWQMGPDFIENPDRIQRCQIAANRLLNALSTARRASVLLMAGYILKRLPGVTGVNVDTTGEMQNTEFIYDEIDGASHRDAAESAASATAPAVAAPGRKLPKLEALDLAGKEVSKVYASGKGFRFAVLDRASGRWVESPVVDDEREALRLRMQAFKQRLDELTAG
jgi:hypothetical protein